MLMVLLGFCGDELMNDLPDKDEHMLRNPDAITRNVIVVDDDPINAMLLTEICNAADWNVSGCASSSREAMAMLRQSDPCCMIIDYKLDGEKTGLDLNYEVKRARPGLFTIMVTGWDINDIAAHIDGPQPDRILRKPIPANILMDLLDSLHQQSNVVSLRSAAS
ncbi:MAG: response regulator [Sphingomonadaceae bacterium]